jgi:hypothetical protein
MLTAIHNDTISNSGTLKNHWLNYGTARLEFLKIIRRCPPVLSIEK